MRKLKLQDFKNFLEKINFFNKINIEEKTKRSLKIFSIFFGMIFGMTAILVTLTLASRSSWKLGLAFEMQQVLERYDEGTYTVGKNIPLSSNISTSAAVYSLLKKDMKANERHFGVIVRIPSILGPVPAVFIYSEKNKKSDIKFAGYALDNGKATSMIKIQSSSNVMKYWEDMIPKIISKTEM
ncbi:MAG: hypothetical protein IJ630_03480 [Treponema sp.]|nr:hypothetical protein [Treponema sp.]